jgi:hypothetical protein
VKRGGFDLRKLQEAQHEAALARRALVARLKARTVQASASTTVEPWSSRFTELSFEQAEAAVARLRLRRLVDVGSNVSVGPALPVNRPTVDLLHAFLRAVITGESSTSLQWPSGQRDLLLLHPLAMLAMICTPPDQTRAGHTWCAAVPDFRTLYFPWRGGATGAAQRSLLIDRAELLKRNGRHLTRRIVQEQEVSEALAKLHETIAHLSNLSLRDKTQPHLAFPTLAEIYPIFVADGGDDARAAFAGAVGELFGRVRHGAAISRLSDHRPILSSPVTAPFGVFGVTARADFRRVLSLPALGHLDVCLLDLGPPALSRLGHQWEDIVGDFVKTIQKRFPGLPVVAITQDGYVHRQVARMIGDGAVAAGTRRSQVLIRSSDEPLTDDPPFGAMSPIAVSVASAAGHSAEALRALSAAARGLSDGAAAGGLRRAMGGLRRAASLPCGLQPAFEWLCEIEGQAAAEMFLERRSRGTVLSPLLDAISGSAGGAERARLLNAEVAVKAAFDGLNDDTPIGSLLGQSAAALVRKSSRSIVVVGSRIELKLAERRLLASDLADAVERKIGTGQLRLVAIEDLENALSEIETSRDRNSWKRLVLVAPTLDRLSALLIRPWLPDDVLILCDHAFTTRLTATYGGLSGHPDIRARAELAARLKSIATAARREAEARAVGPIDLDLEAQPILQAADDVIDLVDDDDESGRAVIVLSLQSGRSLKARPGSVIVRHRRDAEINAFERAVARDISVGEVIVAPDRGFVEEARRVLPIHILALNWVTLFHATIEAALPGLPGDSLAAKARGVSARMTALGARTVSQAAVTDWLKVAEHAAVAAERRRPHAPQNRVEFDAFMHVLDSAPLAEKMWKEGIQHMRVARQRAGLKMAQAFISVLVDPHGAAGGLSQDIREKIAVLRVRALDHLDTVVGA